MQSWAAAAHRAIDERFQAEPVQQNKVSGVELAEFAGAGEFGRQHAGRVGAERGDAAHDGAELLVVELSHVVKNAAALLGIDLLR